MRWPLRRHGRHDSSADAPGALGAVVAEPGNDRAETEMPAATRRDWATLPAMPLTVGAMRTAANAGAFTRTLASRQDISQSQRLSHVRPHDAPAGTVAVNVLPVAPEVPPPAVEPGEASPLPVAEHRHLRAAPRDSPEVGIGSQPTMSAPDLGVETAIDAAIASARGDRPAPEPGTPSDGPAVPPPPPAGGARRNLADSRRMGLGPAYHGSLPEAMRAERERATVEPVPEVVRHVVQQALGVDVGEKMVHRGPVVSAEARAIGAQAFTRDREVFVADEVGDLDSAQARATVAHEMTHVAQQIASTIVPEEHTLEGRAHEAQAQAVEQVVRGDAAAPEMLHVHRGHPADDPDAAGEAMTAMRDLVERGVARYDGRGGIEFVLPPSAMSTGAAGTQRLTTAAPQAGSTAGHQAADRSNWSGPAGFFHQLGQEVAGEALGTIGSVFGFSDSFMAEQRGELDEADKEFQRSQTLDAYRRLRLDHLKTGELRQQNLVQEERGRPRLEDLSSEDLERLTQRVQQDVERRSELLRMETERELERLNRERPEHTDPIEHVDRAKYDQAFHRLFDNPDTDDVPEASEIATMLHAAAAATAAGAAAHSAAGGPAAGVAAGAPPAAGPPTPSTGEQHPGVVAPTAAAAAPGTHTAATGGAAGTGGAGEHGALPAVQHDQRPAAGGGQQPAAHAGGAAGAGGQRPQWEDEQLTVGQRFRSLGTAIGFGAMEDVVGFEGSVFGFSDSFNREIGDSLHSDRDAAMRAARGAPATTTTPDTTHPGAHDGAHPAAHDGVHPAAHDGAHAAGGAAGAAGAAAHAHGRTAATGEPMIETNRLDLDELAVRLYPNIRSRLRQELLIDRERAGLLTDFR